MTPHQPLDRPVPAKVFLLSLLALAIPVLGSLVFYRALGEYGAMLWLVALLPAFVLSYYRGTLGVAAGVAVGMLTLLATYGIASRLMLPIPFSLSWVVVAFLAIAMFIGIHTEFLHRERDVVERMAFTDPLTGLPNRRHALSHLQKEFAAAQRGRMVTVVLFDLDGFKRFNDTYGHNAGDEALRVFGEVLRDLTRQMNLSARLGGEEFISILGGATAEGAAIFANRVRVAMKERSLGKPPLTVSAGVASFDPEMGGPDELLAAADKSLYEAKDMGRDQVRVHPGSMPGPGTGTGAPGPEESAPPEFGKGHRVLVAEADAMTQRILTNHLESEGFEVVTAEDGTEALRELSTGFGFVVMDLALPGSGGARMVASMKSRWPSLQVLVMTGVEGTRMAGRALRAGADSYLVKPFGVPQLRRHMVEAVARLEQARARGTLGTPSDEAGMEREVETRETILQGVRALVRAVEVRDPYTKGHSTRVAAYAALLADGLDPDRSLVDRDRLQLACQLHDVGKLGVPDRILNKVDPLTDEEMAVVRGHTRVGRRMLEAVLHDELVLSVASWHHERWDGSGYPDRLVAEAIPPAARIVALADALDAMTRPRAYREAMTWEEAVSHLQNQGGARHDPDLVKHMTTVLPGLRSIHDRPDPA